MTNKIFVTLVTNDAKVLHAKLQVIPQKGERVFIKGTLYIVEALPDHTISQTVGDACYHKHEIRVYLKSLQKVVK